MHTLTYDVFLLFLPWLEIIICQFPAHLYTHSVTDNQCPAGSKHFPKPTVLDLQIVKFQSQKFTDTIKRVVKRGKLYINYHEEFEHAQSEW